MANIYDELLEKITSPTLTTENWDGILTFCDKINSDIDGAKTGLKALRKRLNNRDPHVVLMAISVLDSSWANCGNKFRKEVSSSQFISELKALCTTSQRLVAEKMRVTVQKWIDGECKTEASLSLVISLHRTLKEDGYSFVVDDPKKKSVAAANAKYANDPNFVSSSQEEEEIAKAIAASLADAEKQEKVKKSSSSLYPTTNGNGNTKASSPSQSSSIERKVRALYDFEAAENNELSFVAGDIITVTDESNPHWWTGRVANRQGLFPSSFVSNDLEENKSNELEFSQKVPEVIASINEAVLVRCLNILHESDPTGERQDPPDLAQLEAASYAQGPLIDSYLASIDKRSNSLAQVDIAIRDVLALYDDAIQKGGYPQNPPMYAPQPVPQQSYGYAQQPQQVPYQQYPIQNGQAGVPQQYPTPQYSAPQQNIASSAQPPYYAPVQTGGAPVAPVQQQWPAQQQY